MIELERPAIKKVEVTDNYGLFVIEPLERGFGQTLGNALRRTLLSSLTGYAITSVKIDGVQHEMSTIPGVLEDVTQIVLRLKQVRVVVDSYSSSEEYSNTGSMSSTLDDMELEVNAYGPCVVKAGDFVASTGIHIINEDLEIANLDDGAVLHMVMKVGKGRGYVSSAKNKSEKKVPVGTIAIDSIYAPIKKVNFTVESTRAAHTQSYDYDKLTLEIETTGCTKPDEAISEAAMILRDQLENFATLTEHAQITETHVEQTDNETTAKINMQIDDLDLSVRSYNCLKRAGINTVGELLEKSEEEMLRVRNLGRKSLDEVHKKLTDLGFKLKSSDN